MFFINDIAGDLPWLTPAPIGTVEPGWTAIVADLLLSIGRAITGHPGVSVDILDLSEHDGELRCDLVVDGTDDPAVTTAIDAAIAETNTGRPRYALDAVSRDACATPGRRGRRPSATCMPQQRPLF